MLDNIKFLIAVSIVLTMGIMVIYFVSWAVITFVGIMIPVILVVLVCSLCYKLFKKFRK